MEISDKTAAIVGFLVMFFTLGALILVSEPTVKSPSLWLASLAIMIGAGIGGGIVMFLFNRSLKKTRKSLNMKEENR